MKEIEVGNHIIGNGIPSIIVPIVGKRQSEIIQKAKELSAKDVDLIEWRADFYEDVLDLSKVLEVLNELKIILQDIPIIFTFRTKREGGERYITNEYYTKLNKKVAQSQKAKIIDIEILSGDDLVLDNINNIHNAGCLVIASNHDFNKTPDENEIIDRLIKMQNMGADILKIAVMPTSTSDVLTLLSATNEMYENHAEKPLVTMSMGPKGVISRLSGEVFKSSMTFGAVGETSAPGQISLNDLKIVLDIIHDAIV